MAEQQQRVVGIDLGTTNSLVAYMQGETPQVIPGEDGSSIVPSVVAFDQETKEGFAVGNAARDVLLKQPANAVYSVKRLMGRDVEDVQPELKLFPFHVAEGLKPGQVLKLDVGGLALTPPEISAYVLLQLKRNAERFFGAAVTKAVITVPAYFNDAQRQATKDAGRIAGLEVLRLVNEPTAAALAYGLDKLHGGKDGVIAVYDFGGGTFDISILKLEDGLFEVLSTSGDTYLGGEDFDKRIIDWLIEGFQRDTGISLAEDRMALQRLKEAAEKAKHELSVSDESRITLPFISADASGPKHLNSVLTRREFEKMVEDLIQKTIDPVNDALKQAGVTAKDIDEVVLVGGQTRMPRVVAAVQQAFGKEPNRNINPDEVVAVGAAVQAGILRGDIKDMILLDVTPLSLGVETHGGVFTKVIERNATIPTKNSLIFTTVADQQNKVTVHVLQGEREFARDNKSLGKFDLVGIPPAPRGVPQIEVTFSIDSNGIVSVTARDQATGQSTGVQINPAGGLSQDEIDRLVNEAAEHSRIDATRRETRMLQNKLEGMIYTNDKVFREFGKMLSEEDRSKVQQCIAKAKESATSEEKQRLNDAIFELQTASRILTSVMLYNPLKMNVPGDAP
ncbi:MAG: molecular chaperone DnaK [Acidobacteria bacterium]|nr:molecular chaperone DnaK [Acidobacteriota bacterium]